MTTPVGGSPVGEPGQPASSSQPKGVLPPGYTQIVDFYQLQGATPAEQIQFVNNWIQQNFCRPIQQEMQYQQQYAQAERRFYSGEDEIFEPPMR